MQVSMDDGALEEVGLLATLGAECRQDNQSCVGDQRAELHTVTKVGQGKEEEDTGEHDSNEWHEQLWAIKGGGFVILAFTLNGILLGHGRPSVTRREKPELPAKSGFRQVRLKFLKTPSIRTSSPCDHRLAEFLPSWRRLASDDSQ
jgi:hypothetical protein